MVLAQGSVQTSGFLISAGHLHGRAIYMYITPMIRAICIHVYCQHMRTIYNDIGPLGGSIYILTVDNEA